MTKAVGAVLREHGGAFSVEELTLAEPSPDEVLVRITATGLCHTDQKVRMGAREVPVPVVLGHEGAGIVAATGSKVSDLSAGDHVVLTFAYCGVCANCASGHPAYCDQADELNFGANGTAISAAGTQLHGAFFGQSSFATHALVDARSAVRVDADLPLELLGPLGCSIQTGIGAILNVLAPDKDSAVAVWGTGAVGLSAIIAAHWLDCRQIIAIDIKPARLELARELGATGAVLVTPDVDARAALRELVPGGVTHAFDTTGRPKVLAAAVATLAPRGSAAFVGGARAGDTVAIEVNPLLAGRSLQGIVQGDAVPQQFIPMLTERFRRGELPLERLISHYPLTAINQALADAEAGLAIKPVLTMPTI